MLSNIIIILALCISFFLGFFAGGYIVGTKELYIAVSKKEDFLEKQRDLEDVIEKLMAEEGNVPIEYKPEELMPPGLGRDYGLPRKL